MRFGSLALEDAKGAVLAHAVLANGKRIRKGTLLGADEITLLKGAGTKEIIAAAPDPGDLGEDETARRVAGALQIRNVEAKTAATGRVNLHAVQSGVFTVDTSLIDAVNSIDPAITLATLADYAPVRAGQMVATVKIIPFWVAGDVLEEAEKRAGEREAFAVHGYRARSIAMVQTVLPSVKTSVLDKTLELTRARLVRSGSTLASEVRIAHDESALQKELKKIAQNTEFIVIFGASAMCDANDIIPAAIRAAGGAVEHVGMPVDPGNLLVFGNIGNAQVIGAPGCARSPKENGFDWVLDRLMADIPVTGKDITAMGVGGLLMEIPTRPQPRELRKRTAPAIVDALLLAAGRSSRMGGPNKLLADFGGQPLVRRMAERLLASTARSLTVVTGHQRQAIEEALDGLDVRFIYNPEFASGLASSLKAGVAALQSDCSAALIALADMPAVTKADFDTMITAAGQPGTSAIIRATHNGKRGNPVILPSAVFADIGQLQGDTGARNVIETSGLPIIDVEIGAAASVDVDTPEALARAGGVLVEES